MKLYFSATAPFVRKVLVMASETGLRDRIELAPLVVSPMKDNPAIAPANPAMKIPTLVLDDGTSLFDSRVICEYLDTLHQGRKMIPLSGPERWRVLRFQSMCDAMDEAGLQFHYEKTMRPTELIWRDWLDGQGRKALQSIDRAQAELDPSEPVHLGHIALACAIGWFELRRPLGDLRPGRDKLFAWYEQFSRRPSMIATAPQD